MMFICFILLMLSLAEKIVCKEITTLSCGSQEQCRCEANTLDCFFVDVKFDLPSKVELPEQISSVVILGRNYTIDITDNVHNETWSQVRHLTIIGSSGREGLKLPLTFTEKLTNITTLVIRNSNLSAIASGAFSKMNKIIEIDISNNSFLNIIEVEKGLQNFTSRSLKLFNISAIHNAENMNLFTVTRGLFHPICSVEILDMSWTRAFSLDASFDMMPNLTCFNMSGTYIFGPDNCFSTLNRLPRIETLAMDHWPTLARNGDVSFSPYNHYIVRRASVNCPAASFKDNRTGCIILRSSIKQIYMRNVQSLSFFLSFEKGFCVLDNNLEVFTIRGLKTNEPVNIIKGFHKLKLFDVSYIGIHFTFDAIEDMPALETFLSAGNKLKTIESYPEFEKIFDKNKNLKRIDLSENELSYIPYNMFKNNLLIQVLDLSRNVLTNIKLNFSGHLDLRKINLHHNRLFTIDERVLNHLDFLFDEAKSVIDINLVKNDFICNCDNIKFVKWIHSTKHDVEERDNLLCSNSFSEAIRVITLDTVKLERNCSHALIHNKGNDSQNEEHDSPVVIYIGVSVAIATVIVLVVVSVCLYRRGICYFQSCRQQKKPVACRDSDGLEGVSTITRSVNLEEVQLSQTSETFVLMTNGITSQCKRRPQYTVFIAYCHDDAEFVVRKIYGTLEKCLREFLPHKNKDTLTLLYDKNFLPGEDLVQICKAAVYNSYVTVAIVSDNFLKSGWCSYEMQTAFDANIPIIPVYLGKCQEEDLCGIFKVIHDSKVRLVWPQDTLHEDSVSQNEIDFIHCLASSITTYVKKFDSNIL